MPVRTQPIEDALNAAADLLFLDLETTGLSPFVHEILEVAAIRTTPDAFTIKEVYTARMFPERLDVSQPEALKLNGYNAAEWSRELCEQPHIVAERLAVLSKDAMLVGQNVSFDMSCVDALLFKLRMGFGPWSKYEIDIASIAWPLVQAKRIESPSLVNIANFLGLKLGEPRHRALADAEYARSVYISLLSYFKQFTVR